MTSADHSSRGGVPYIMTSQPIEQLSIKGSAEFKNYPVVVLRRTPGSKQAENYDEYWTDPAAKYRIVKWFRDYFQQLKMSTEIAYANDDRESEANDLCLLVLFGRRKTATDIRGDGEELGRKCTRSKTGFCAPARLENDPFEEG